jgi:hypothetical protein
MPARGEVAASLGDEDVIDLFSNRLPELLERRPDLEPTIFGAFLKTFARREEVALVLTELRTLRTEMNQRFERVDQGFEQVDQQMHEVRTEVATGFGEVQRSIDRLGARWGIRSESVFRQTMAAVLEQSFGVGVEQRTVAGEQFDIVIHDHEHILVEIAASVGPTIQTRLERKRRLYQESTGVSPTRIILATASIHSRRAHELRMSGIEVIEPEETEPAAT